MKNISRRDFLKGSLAYGACACCAAAWGPLRPQNVFAQSAGGNGRTAVFLNQFGGADPLNSFSVPYTIAGYYDRRPTIAHPANTVLDLNGVIGFNPVLGGGANTLHDLYLAGDVAVIQGVGDPQNTRSHFTAQENMSRGVTTNSAIESRGWIGRMGDLYFPDQPFNTFGIGVGQMTDFRSNRTTNQPVVTPNLSGYAFSNDTTANPTGVDFSRDNQFRRNIMRGFLGTSSSGLTDREKSVRIAEQAFHDGTATIAAVNAQTVGTFTGTTPGPFFRDSARLVRYGLGTKVSYGGIGGWDDHSALLTSQATNLGRVNTAVRDFAADMKAAGKWDQVVICIFSEFGRNTFENASGGCDHGWGGTMLLVGGGVNGGVYGATPSDNELRTRPWVYGDVDFRSVFSRIVAWLGFNPSPVFPESYTDTPLALFA